MTTATNIQAASNQGSNPKLVLTFEEALEQNAHHYALTAADDPARAEFFASLMGHLGVDYSHVASTITLNPDATERYANNARSCRPFEEALERFAPVYAALAVEDLARIEFGTALTSQGKSSAEIRVRRPNGTNDYPF